MPDLYLISPNPLPADFPRRLEQALAAGDVAALLLRGATAPAAIAAVRAVTLPHGVALLLDGNPALAVATGCDGAHLPDPAGTASARRVLGDLQLGVSCGASRDAAMSAGEAGADYVAFGPYGSEDGPQDTDLLAWWSALMELPVVAEGAITAANCAPLVRARADFLAVGDAVWNHEAGPGAAVRAMIEAMNGAAP